MNRFLSFALFVAAACALAPLYTVPADKRIDGSYIVVLYTNTSISRLREIQLYHLAAAPSHTVQFEWTVVYPGFAGQITEKGVDLLRSLPEVEMIEEDQVMSIDYKKEVEQTCNTQNGATWGISRVSKQVTGTNNVYRSAYTGSGGRVFVIDTGIRTTHNEFSGGRAIFINGGDFINEGTYPNGQDGNGHGTHCAGTIAGTTYGIAKSATVVAVKVLSSSGSGSTAGVISGVNFAAAQRVANRDVASMSLGGGASTTLDAACNNAASGGLAVAVAAGNDNANACNYSPARATGAITVGATAQGTANDPRSTFSNFGNCVDIFAPGTSITSAWSTSNTATNTISGTSMACPHVAGVIALYTQQTTATPATTRTNLINRSQATVNNGGAGSPNRFLFNNNNCAQ